VPELCEIYGRDTIKKEDARLAINEEMWNYSKRQDGTINNIVFWGWLGNNRPDLLTVRGVDYQQVSIWVKKFNSQQI